MPSGDASMSDWLRIWSEVSRRHIAAKDSQGATLELLGLYAELDPNERRAANEDLFEALRTGDETQRYDSLAIISKFKLAEAMPYLKELGARLQLDGSPGAPFELVWVQGIIGGLLLGDATPT